MSASPRRAGSRRLRSPWRSSSARSTLRIRSGHPAGERPVPAVVRRFEEHRLPELVVAAVAGDPDVSHAAAAPGRLPGRLAEARCPARLRLAGPQLVTERAGFRLVLEQRSGHRNDHARTSCHESMIIVTCTDDRAGRAPGTEHVARVARCPRAWRWSTSPNPRGSRRWPSPSSPSPLVSAAPAYRKPRGRWRGSRARQQPGVRSVRRDASEADVASITMQFFDKRMASWWPS